VSAAVVEAPLVASTAKALSSKEEAMKWVQENVTDTDKQVLYWQLWRELGLIQLKESKIGN